MSKEEQAATDDKNESSKKEEPELKNQESVLIRAQGQAVLRFISAVLMGLIVTMVLIAVDAWKEDGDFLLLDGLFLVYLIFSVILFLEGWTVRKFKIEKGILEFKGFPLLEYKKVPLDTILLVEKKILNSSDILITIISKKQNIVLGDFWEKLEKQDLEEIFQALSKVVDPERVVVNDGRET